MIFGGAVIAGRVLYSSFRGRRASFSYTGLVASDMGTVWVRGVPRTWDRVCLYVSTSGVGVELGGRLLACVWVPAEAEGSLSCWRTWGSDRAVGRAGVPSY